MGQRNGNRGAQRGVNAASRRSNASTQAANDAYDRTGNPNSAEQRAANRDADDLATQRAHRRH